MVQSAHATHQHASTRVVAERMAEAATAWLASLSTDQRRKGQYGFPANDERTRWYYTPTEQGGLPLAEMTPPQQRLAHQLVATGLSVPGYNTAAIIMGIENVLDAKEGFNFTYAGRTVPSRGRDPMLYFVSAFGDPGSRAWGWRVGGHHISVHYSVLDGLILSPSPLFFGSNPAETQLMGASVLRPLAGEEDLGRELLHALDAEQQRVAIISHVAPRDIVQANRPFVELGAAPRAQALIFGEGLSEERLRALAADEDRQNKWLGIQEEHVAAVRYEAAPKGLAATQMSAAQRGALKALIHQYLDRMPPEIASIEAERVGGPAFDGMHFAWAGGSARRQPHYYRVQGPRLLIEYDNVQNDTNHIHAVWRDPENDFGADVLAQHYHESH